MSDKSEDEYELDKLNQGSDFTLMFRDGKRQIDLILCYEENEKESEEIKKIRSNFEKDLKEAQLELEYEKNEENLCFIKIHVPSEMLEIFAEDYEVKKLVENLKYQELDEDTEEEFKRNPKTNCISSFIDWRSKLFDLKFTSIREASFHSQIKYRDNCQLFIEKIYAENLNSAQRSTTAYQMLHRINFTESENRFPDLIQKGIYKACYPLHEEVSNNHEVTNDKTKLNSEWASFGKWYKKQPLWLVRKYFGEKIALYFCWLGFYTNMLVLPAIIGLVCFIYGLVTINSADSIPSKDICDIKRLGNVTLCPLCNNACSYLKLFSSCLYSKISYIFDNSATVFFAVFMSFWATIFLELWKRKLAIIKWEWDLNKVKTDEAASAEFESSVKTYRINPITKQKEQYLRVSSKIARLFVSGTTVLTMMTFILAVFLGVISYRLSVLGVIYSSSGENLRGHAKLITSLTASIINFIIMMIFSRIYPRVCLWLTTFERPRTQTEYEDSYTLKIFALEFINFYGTLIYIAFFKGKFFSSPGDGGFLNLKFDICDPSGCFVELCIQLAIIMVGKQIINNLREYNILKILLRCGSIFGEKKKEVHTSWEKDYQLQDLGRFPLFEEYKKMIIQYGFVTLFVAAFPLGPFFALLNNIVETRLDANKLLNQSRRPIAARAEDIGIWYYIIDVISWIAVIYNGMIIAFTSEFIPKFVYKFIYSDKMDLEGYVENSLESFNTTHYPNFWGQDQSSDICYYNNKNSFSPQSHISKREEFWQMLFIRITFVFVFEHLMLLFKKIFTKIIPDIPHKLKVQMQYETKQPSDESGSISDVEY